jgi:hypothetical protein
MRLTEGLLRIVLRAVGIFLVVGAMVGSAVGGTAHFYPISANLTPIDDGNAILTPDGNPVLLGIVVDSSSATSVYGLQWEVAIGPEGQGLAFNAGDSQSRSRDMATNNPDYLLYGDSDGFYAFATAKGLAGSDLDPTPGSGHAPVGKRLGVVSLNMTDPGAVTTQLGAGGFTVSDPYSYLLLDDYFSTESLDIPAYNLVPEPGTTALVVVGGLAVLCRRRAARTAR